MANRKLKFETVPDEVVKKALKKMKENFCSSIDVGKTYYRPNPLSICVMPLVCNLIQIISCIIQLQITSSIGLGFLNPSYQLRHTDVTAFCMQLTD